MLFKKGSSPSSQLFKKGVGVQLFKKSGDVASSLAPIVRPFSPAGGLALAGYGALSKAF